MGTTLEALEKELKSRNIHLSYQRLKVLEYLFENRCHPTVDQIFTGLHKDIPTLSKTTVYNTLGLLIDAGLVRVITIEENETRYDIEVETHGHFKCEACGAIHNFTLNPASLVSEDLNDFKIRERDVYFKGLCPACLLNMDTKK
jgi:Fe2+ or Zn2+ uptake regulation protein